MERNRVNFKEKFSLFKDRWSPRIIAEMDDIQFKLVRLQGDFVWHDHADEDETFIVLEGEMFIDFLDGRVDLSAGEMMVIPKGVKHKPGAENECGVLLVEPRGVVNTGDAGGELTKDAVWI